MRSEELIHYRIRGRSPSHDSPLPTHLDKPEREFFNLVKTAFGHQRAIYNTPTVDQEIDLRAAKYFYEHCFRVTPVRLGRDGAQVPIDDFINDVILSQPGRGRNALSYLLGDVGVGKTSLVNYLISARLDEHVRSGRIWFLRLDMEQIADDTEKKVPLDHSRILFFVVRKVARILGDYPELIQGNDMGARILAQINNQLNDLQSQFNALAARFTKLVNSIFQHSQRRLFLVFDNLDYVSHIHDRFIFQHSTDTGELPLLESLHGFMRKFIHSQVLGQLEANVLFVARYSSYRLLVQTDGTSQNAFITDSELRAYSCQAPSLEQVFEARYELMSFLADSVPLERKRKDFTQLAKVIQSHLTAAPTANERALVDHIYGVANHGLRQLMRFFTQYGWSSEAEHVELTVTRFMHQYPVGLLTFMLNGRCRFHQFDARFPNIYLVYALPTDRESAIHRHSYWLKRLIIEFIFEETSCKPEQIIAAFAGHGGYEEYIVRKCLNSLCEANGSNMIAATRVKHPSNDVLMVESVHLTRRGEHCLKYIFDRFFYLQLIVDDFYLPLPRTVAERFEFGDLDYRYVVGEPDEYRSSARAMIKEKALQVMIFLEILDISLDCEKTLYSDVFDRITRIPEPTVIRERVITELKALSHAQQALDIDFGRLAEICDDARDGLREQLDKAYTASS